MAKTPSPIDPSSTLNLADATFEEIDVDDDVSVAGLGAELLPTGEVQIEPEGEALYTEVVETREPAAPQHTLPLLLSREITSREAPLPPLRPEEEAEEATGEAVEPALVGTTAAVPFIDILLLLARQQQTGILTLVQDPDDQDADPRQIQIALLKGRIALATARGLPELRLGRFARELFSISDADLDALVRSSSYLIGQRLCETGYLSGDDLRTLLVRQTQELVYEAVAQPSGAAGRYRFTAAVVPAWATTPPAPLSLDTEAVLLEGYRRIEDHYLLDRELDEKALYLPAEERHLNLERLGLSAEEHRVFSLCTGRNALSDIIRSSQLVPLSVFRILRRLQAMHLVRRRLPAQIATS
jgi:hypothetical protein